MMLVAKHVLISLYLSVHSHQVYHDVSNHASDEEISMQQNSQSKPSRVALYNQSTIAKKEHQAGQPHAP